MSHLNEWLVANGIVRETRWQRFCRWIGKLILWVAIIFGVAFVGRAGCTAADQLTAPKAGR